jgi:SAM-dependent methyltransferase
MDTYLPSTPARILEIGAQNVNGTLRDHAPRNAEYIGLDFEEGDGVDVVVTDVTDWPVPDAHFDLVMASSVFEHDKTFWRTFVAMCDKAKPGGHIYVSAPSNGTFHRYPKDYWRFYPDSGLALEEWARSEGRDVTLIESFVADREADVWNDFCAVFRRGPSDAGLNRDFICKKVPSSNALTWRSSKIINPIEDSQDTRLLSGAREETQRWVLHAGFLNSEFSAREKSWDDERARLTQEIEQQTNHIASLDQTAAAKGEQVTALQARADELQLELDRLGAETEEQMAEHDERTRDLTGRLSELQSRLAQRDEEATQAWATADERERERERLAAELQKVKGDLVNANGWVEELALTRTQMERSVARLEKALAKASKDAADMVRRNGDLEERIASLSARPAPSDISLDRTTVRAAEARSESVVHDQELAERSLAAAKREQAESSIALGETLAELADSRSQLEECRDDIAKLSDMLAEAQDQVADLERQNVWLREAGLFLLSRDKWWWRFMPRGWQRKKRDDRLRSRGLFDSEVYENRYPDVASTGQDSFRHYLYHGVTENRRYD